MAGDSTGVAALHIRLMKYDEGNAVLRFFFGFWGNGEVTLNISINERHTGETLVAGTQNIKVSGFSVNEVIDPLGDGIRNFVEDYFVKEKQLAVK